MFTEEKYRRGGGYLASAQHSWEPVNRERRLRNPMGKSLPSWKSTPNLVFSQTADEIKILLDMQVLKNHFLGTDFFRNYWNYRNRVNQGEARHRTRKQTQQRGTGRKPW